MRHALERVLCLHDYLMELFASNDMDAEDIINYKQWIHVERINLVLLQCSLSEFVPAICDASDELRPHHFTAKCQSTYDQ